VTKSESQRHDMDDHIYTHLMATIQVQGQQWCLRTLSANHSRSHGRNWVVYSWKRTIPHITCSPDSDSPPHIFCESSIITTVLKAYMANAANVANLQSILFLSASPSHHNASDLSNVKGSVQHAQCDKHDQPISPF
jgi:hypothetical protein